ncbi:class I SAM-dependent methyltransferase [Bdellovibrio reynosensis]|uniref:Class I SAM-dependent methyltransferase n=1 Tax=Bdellovibrio reynosensis TaxID=2835041 RepID=A0ABY4CG46_9BACT|nr:class I SAM-dependent methyltransferase [Bdellovibrio reynosensis]UOF02852.1 class I SAM-dependent methyltransferase [Bdellovibrio reynosensis]
MTKEAVAHRKKVRRRIQRKTTKVHFDKYELYTKAVQSAPNDVVFIRDTFKELKGRNARTYREDFCGTFALSTEWIKLNPRHEAIGIDLDPEPMAYGRQNYLSKMRAEQQRRMKLIEGNVLDPNLPKADIVAAMNFSYFCFKQRDMLKKYFANVHKTLNKDGIFLVDIFGGSQCYDAIEDTIKHEGFTYYWDQTNFDPVTNEALFHIHFKVGGKKIEQVFTYDWRLWTIPEIRDIMEEVGFKKTHVYWEGTAKDGSGDGNFTRVDHGEACESWIAYVVAEK